MDTKIFIDIDDEITFVAERIFNAPTDRVILVAPERSAITSSITSLKMLRRQLERHGQKLIIVTLDEHGRTLAEKSGFVAKSRVGEVDEDAWSENDKTISQPTKVIPISTPLEEEQEITSPIEGMEDIYDKEMTTQEAKITTTPLVEETSSNAEEQIDNFINDQNHKLDSEETLADVVSANKLKKAEIIEKEPEILDTFSKFDNTEDNNITNEIKNSPKFVASSKKVNLEGFDMLIGGDIAIEKASENIDYNNVLDIAAKVEDFSKNSSILGQDVSGHSKQNQKTETVKERKGLKERGLIAKLLQHKNNINTPKKKTKKGMKKYFIILILLLVVLGFGYVYFFLPSATIKITAQTKDISTTSTITASPNTASVDTNSKQIPAQFSEVTESNSNSATTTGTTTVGTKATGTVTILNHTSQVQQLTAGTVITTNDSSNLQYTLESAISVPAANLVASLLISSGQISANVSAGAIGSKYNIVANSTFNINGYSGSQVEAFNPAAFSGGDSKTVQSVSATDVTSLLNKTQSDLFQKGQTDLQTKVGKDENLISSSIKNAVVQKTYDNAIGSEASTLNLSLTTKTNGLAFKQSDIDSISKSMVSALSNGFPIESSTGTVIGTPVIDTNGNIVINIKVLGKIGASIDKKSLATELKGKSVTSATTTIKSIKGVTDVQINIQPAWLRSFFKHLPFQSNKISISTLDKS